MVAVFYKELIMRRGGAVGSELQTVYLGGGTPSTLAYDELKQPFDTIYGYYKVGPTAETTIERNPGGSFRLHTPKQLLQQLTSLGINRLSLRVQSFFEEDLCLMNRMYATTQITTLLPIASQYFDNIAIDLIYDIPMMNNKRWRENIYKALSSEIPHISAYALTVEGKTTLHRFIAIGKVPPINDTQAYTHSHTLINILEKGEFIQYGFSNFGKEGYFSQSNTAYWFGKPYTGIGPSTHSFDDFKRSWNIAHNIRCIQQIQQGILPQEVEILIPDNGYSEFIITRTRTMAGTDLEEVDNVSGKEYQQYLLIQAKKYTSKGLLCIKENRLRVAKDSKFLSGGIASDLFRMDNLI